jgi:siroheme synthase-like protein
MSYAYMPVSLSLTDQPCLVVGGGAVALRKIETLIDHGGSVTVVAPEVDEKVQYFADSDKIALEKRPYKPGEAANYRFVISASDDMDVNRQVSDDSRGGGALVNVVDKPTLCDFIFPAVIRRGDLSTAISTDGKAPFMSGHLRKILEDIFPPHWKKLIEKAGEFRKMVQKRWGGDMHQKTVCYTQFLEADWKSLLKEKDKAVVAAAMEKMLEPREEHTGDGPPVAEFGPDDPGENA